MEEVRGKIEDLIAGGDYISAYELIRKDDELRGLYAGRIVNAVVNDLASSENKRSKEKVYFYRSILLWIFRDMPGLAPLYRSQIREGSFVENSPDLLRLLSWFSAYGTRNAPRSSEEAAEGVKEAVDGVLDDIKTGKADEKIQDLFHTAGEGLLSGMKGVSDFLDSLAGTTAARKDGASDDDTKN